MKHDPEVWRLWLGFGLLGGSAVGLLIFHALTYRPRPYGEN